ncbi:MAG: enoyl-CoA hydratase/isomerase family protein [Alphaproteobacteria bacterium]|nr:enoyl-CoA hydratase/isomerase family protein [Alphaproteobacteria bacterium]
MTTTVLTTEAPGHRLLTLNRPERLNAINGALLDGLAAGLAAANADRSIASVILTGAGRAFCAGDDLKEFEAQARTEAEARSHVERIQAITRLIVGSPHIVIVAASGWAVGGGLEWTINADLVVMADDTRCFFPELSLGLFVTGGVTYLLPERCGRQQALELMLLSERFDAARAKELGIAGRVVPRGRLLDEATEMAAKIAALPVARVRELKRAIQCATNLDTAMTLETEATIAAFLDPDTARRIAGFGRR